MPFRVFNLMPHIFWSFWILGIGNASHPPPLVTLSDCCKVLCPLASGSWACSWSSVPYLVANKKNPLKVSPELCCVALLSCPLPSVLSQPWHLPETLGSVLPPPCAARGRLPTQGLGLGHLQDLLICFLNQRSLPKLEAECFSFYIVCLFFSSSHLRQESIWSLLWQLSQNPKCSIELSPEFSYVTNNIKP